MRRLLVSLLICLLPLQWAWATVHDASHCLEDVGHAVAAQMAHTLDAQEHEHQRSSAPDAPGETGQTGTHACEGCTDHCSHVHLLALVTAQGSQSHLLRTELRAGLASAHLPLGSAQSIERPNWGTAPALAAVLGIA